MPPYRSSLLHSMSSSYFLLGSTCKIFMRSWTSLLFIICFWVASLTFRTFPRSGKTLYASQLIISVPATASDYALSPFVTISGVLPLLSQSTFKSAQLALWCFSTPRTSSLLFFPLTFFPSCYSCFTFAATITYSEIATRVTISSKNFSLRLGYKPQEDFFKFIVSFTYESKVGFTNKQLMKI